MAAAVMRASRIVTRFTPGPTTEARAIATTVIDSQAPSGSSSWRKAAPPTAAIIAPPPRASG